MAKTLEIGVGNLPFKLGTNAFRIVGSLSATGTITARFFKSLLYHIDYIFVGIKRNFHIFSVPNF